MYESSGIELNFSALKNNLAFLQNYFGKSVQISSVVKGNAYGHGINEFVPMVVECGVRHFSVFSSDEAMKVKNAVNDSCTVMIMGFVENDALEWAIAHDVEFFVFDMKRLKNAVKIAQRLNKTARIHLEVETGMNRTGFTENDLKGLVTTLRKELKNIELKGLCTHYAGAENVSNHQRVRKQINTFEKIYQYFIDHQLTPEYRHTACSAASVMFPETRMEMVRIGIMQYGLWSSPETQMHYLDSADKRKDPLKRVITWKSRVMNIKKINQGEYIGYGNSFIAHGKMKIAVVPVGYAHGYSRSLSNQGRVLINEQLCMVAGKVNMNMLIVDVSELDQIQIGDEVVMIGNQGDLSVSVASFSDFNNRLNYELLSRLPGEIPRKIIK